VLDPQSYQLLLRTHTVLVQSLQPLNVGAGGSV